MSWRPLGRLRGYSISFPSSSATSCLVPVAPFAVRAVCAGLGEAGLWLSPPGVSLWMATTTRSMFVVTLLSIAYLLRQYKRTEEELRASQTNLERRVEARTTEVHVTNQQLGTKIQERERTKQDLARSNGTWNSSPMWPRTICRSPFGPRPVVCKSCKGGTKDSWMLEQKSSSDSPSMARIVCRRSSMISYCIHGSAAGRGRSRPRTAGRCSRKCCTT